MLKTHVDIFDQWDDAIVQQLQALAEKHGARSEHRTTLWVLLQPCRAMLRRSVRYGRVLEMYSRGRWITESH